MQEKCTEANLTRPNERYHLEISEEGAVPGSQGTSGFVKVGWQKTRRCRSHEREACHWRGTLPYQTHLLTRTLVTRRQERQQQLTERQQTKQQKYTDLAKTHHFVLIAVETSGAWNALALEFITELGRRIARITQELRETQFLFQRLSISLQRGNTVAFKNTFSSEH